MSAEDLEKYETEMELSLYREYKDIVGQFSYVVESGVDLPHQMIFRYRIAKLKLLEQLALVTLQTAHHGSTSP